MMVDTKSGIILLYLQVPKVAISTPMPAPTDFAALVKQQADIVRVIGDYVKLRKAGAQNYSGLCPFHAEKSPSFSVHATRQFYHCFGCGASGDVFSFVQKIENITFPEAVRSLSGKLNIPLPKTTYSGPQEAKEARLRMVLMDLHERATAWFEAQLQRPEAAAAREYLAGRGLSPEMIRAFRIGYAPDSGFLLRDALKGSFEEEVLRESGLFSWKQEEVASGQLPVASPQSLVSSRESSAYDPAEDSAAKPALRAMYAKFRNRVMFPICNESGKVIAFTGRTLSTDAKAGPKYMNSPETAIYSKGRVLFNLHQAKAAIKELDYAIVVEGQMDCISVFAAGFRNVIASSGTAFAEAQAKLLGRFSKKIVVNFDPDNAGAKAAERTLGLLVEEEFEIKVLTLEQGLDPDLFIRQKGAGAYAAALKTSPRYFQYLIERAQGQFPVRQAEGKVAALNFLLPHLQRVPSRIVRDELAQEIAQKLGIDSGVLRQELRHAAVNRGTKSVQAPPQSSVTHAERILIRALATAGELNDGEGRVSAREGTDEPFDPARQARFFLEDERLTEGLATEPLLHTLMTAEERGDPMALAASDAERRLLASVLMDENEVLTPELLEAAVSALRGRVYIKRKEELNALIREAERKGDAAELMRLLREKTELDREERN